MNLILFLKCFYIYGMLITSMLVQKVNEDNNDNDIKDFLRVIFFGIGFPIFWTIIFIEYLIEEDN